MIAGMVGTIAGSPMPLTPSGPIGSGSSMMIELTRGTSSDVGRMYLAKPGVVVWPSLELVVLHQSLTERLHDAAFDLAFDALRIDRAADVVRRPDAEHLHLAGDGIDFDFGDLAAEHIGLPGPAGAVDRIEAGACRCRTSRSRPAPRRGFLAHADGFAHGDAVIGVLGPDFAVAGADRVGLDVPDLGHHSTSRLRASREASATTLPIM